VLAGQVRETVAVPQTPRARSIPVHFRSAEFGLVCAGSPACVAVRSHCERLEIGERMRREAWPAEFFALLNQHADSVGDEAWSACVRPSTEEVDQFTNVQSHCSLPQNPSR
jgi:hypothetical protein